MYVKIEIRRPRSVRTLKTVAYRRDQFQHEIENIWPSNFELNSIHNTVWMENICRSTSFNCNPVKWDERTESFTYGVYAFVCYRDAAMRENNVDEVNTFDILVKLPVWLVNVSAVNFFFFYFLRWYWCSSERYKRRIYVLDETIKHFWSAKRPQSII